MHCSSPPSRAPAPPNGHRRRRESGPGFPRAAWYAARDVTPAPPGGVSAAAYPGSSRLSVWIAPPCLTPRQEEDERHADSHPQQRRRHARSRGLPDATAVNRSRSTRTSRCERCSTWGRSTASSSRHGHRSAAIPSTATVTTAAPSTTPSSPTSPRLGQDARPGDAALGLQHGRSVIPKSTKPSRIAENSDVSDFGPRSRRPKPPPTR
jgi:hypothetical protein